jgi:hypothetical protein
MSQALESQEAILFSDQGKTGIFAETSGQEEDVELITGDIVAEWETF